MSLPRFDKASQRISLRLTACFVVVFFLSLSTSTQAQHRYSKTYPASGNVKIQLKNRGGTVTVSGWSKSEIQVTVTREAPYAKCIQEMNGSDLIIDLVRDNQGQGEVGNVRFDLNVPYSAKVDIETLLGDISIKNVEGSLVRAHVTTEGDITLTNIKSESVIAKNGTGNIFFDGELKAGGTYQFSSFEGNINIRIPFNSSFRLVATAPVTRNIALGAFSRAGLNFIDQRRVVGNVGDGKAQLTVMNQRGSIAFLQR